MDTEWSFQRKTDKLLLTEVKGERVCLVQVCMQQVSALKEYTGCQHEDSAWKKKIIIQQIASKIERRQNKQITGESEEASVYFNLELRGQ